MGASGTEAARGHVQRTQPRKGGKSPDPTGGPIKIVPVESIMNPVAYSREGLVSVRLFSVPAELIQEKGRDEQDERSKPLELGVAVEFTGKEPFFACFAQDTSRPIVKNHHSVVLRAESAAEKYSWLTRLLAASGNPLQPGKGPAGKPQQPGAKPPSPEQPKVAVFLLAYVCLCVCACVRLSVRLCMCLCLCTMHYAWDQHKHTAQCTGAASSTHQSA